LSNDSLQPGAPSESSENLAVDLPADLPADLTAAVTAIEDRKGEEVLVLDLRGIASFTDYIIMCSGGSERHVQAIVDAIVDQLRDQKVKALNVEGYGQASWVLIDYVDFLVNVFTRETRDFYHLERVWRDAPVLVGERESAPA
jgi:ribosome-associated protein